MKRKIFFILLVLLALFALPFGPVAAEEFADFYDVNSHWAGESIAQCRAYQLMSGYPGNVFMPDQSLSRAEALVVIGRSLGWDKQAGNMATSGIKFPADLWVNFRGYVALAANKQLINKNDISLIKFNDPATRIEMASWMSRALNLTGNGAALSFNDLNQVPATSRNELAGVVEAGILKGLPGNLFAPSKPLTRAEMATILARLIDGGKITPAAGRHVAGKLKTVSRDQKKITLETPYGANTYDLEGSYLVYRNGRKSSQDDLAAGENVKISLNQYGRCIIIAYGDSASQSGWETKTYSGKVVSLNNGFLVFQPDTGSVLGLNLSATALITQSGSTIASSSVTAGARGTITVSGEKVIRIDLAGATTPSQAGERGYVANKYIDYFTVRLGYRSVQDIWPSGIFFTRNGVSSSYGALKRGDYVELVRSGAAVTAVRILDGDRKVFGEVKQVNSQFISVEDDDRRETEFTINGGVRVLDNDGHRADLDDVESGGYVELTLDGSDNVREIKINKDSGNDLEGTVEEIRTSGTKKITIEDNDGDSHTYYLAEGVTVREGSTTRSLGDVRTDMRVQLTLDSRDDVTLIEILGSYTVEGEVTYVKTSGTKRIEITKSNGDDKAYYLADGVTVREGSATRTLDDVRDGMNVKLYLNDDSRVIRIEIADESTVEGEVTYISASGTKRIRIKKSGGSEKTYYMNGNVTVKEDGRTRSLDDIYVGMEVRLTLDSSGDVTRIEILDSNASSDVEGEVTHIQTTGNNRIIEIEDASGRERTYYLATGVTVREGGESRSLNYIVVGMKVELSLNGSGDVNRIEINQSSGSSTVEGEVTDIRTSGTKRISIKKNNGQEVTYYLDSYVTVRESGSNRDLYDVEKGMNVKLTLDNNEVTRIDIYGSSTVEGEVTYIRTAGTKRIEIEKSNGSDETFYIDSGVTVREGDDARSLSAVEIGMVVRLTLNVDDRVTRIEIIGVDHVQGEVTYIKTSGTKRIDIKKSNGYEKTYYINDNVTVKEGNYTRNLSSVTTGMEVELTLDSDSRVTRIDILENA